MASSLCPWVTISQLSCWNDAQGSFMQGEAAQISAALPIFCIIYCSYQQPHKFIEPPSVYVPFQPQSICLQYLIMGKLRNILSRLIGYKPDQKLIAPICTHPHLPERQHYTKLITNAHDHCRTCQSQMCLVCSEVHVQQHCTLQLKVNRELGEGTLRDFNLGYLMELPLNGLNCICGKPLGHEPEHAICAACGLASCSNECHHEWQKQGNCTYHLNYYQKPEDINMRSILFRNVKNIQAAKISEWNVANKSALSYIACYAKAGASFVYLQRGYRNYGQPQPQLVKQMTKVEFGLDFTTHIERLCDCKCEVCLDRGHHSVGNCEYSCGQLYEFNSLQYRDDTEMYYQCSCDCKFCTSGIIVGRHTKLDCLIHCYKSDYNVNRIE